MSAYRGSRVAPVRVSEVFGLKPSEGHVAAFLAEGNSVPETTAEAGSLGNIPPAQSLRHLLPFERTGKEENEACSRLLRHPITPNSHAN